MLKNLYSNKRVKANDEKLPKLTILCKCGIIKVMLNKGVYI